MKIRFTLGLFLVLCIAILNQSYKTGTGLGSTFTDCNTCHTGGTGTTDIDSIVFVNPLTGIRANGSYVPNITYNVYIYAKNVGGSLNKFGFQLDNNGKGTWTNSTGMSSIWSTVWGHNNRITATGNSLGVSCTWTAPPAGTGTVDFSCYINAVNGNDATSGDKPSSLITVSLTEFNIIPVAEVTIARVATNKDTICNGDIQLIKATPTNGGPLPIYRWFLNGADLGIGLDIHTFGSNLQVGDNEIFCVMTSSQIPVQNSPDTSNILKIHVKPNFINSNTITVDKSSGCASDTFTFVSTAAAGAINPEFSWFVNGTKIQSGSSDTFIHWGINTGDSVHCETKVDNECPDVNKGKSNVIYPTIATSAGMTGAVNQTKCFGDTFPVTQWVGNANTLSLDWTCDNTAIGLAASGTGNLPMLVNNNTTNSDIVANITIIPKGATCDGGAVTITYTAHAQNALGINPEKTTCAESSTILSFKPITDLTVIWTISGDDIGVLAGVGNPAVFTPTNNTDTVKTAYLTARSLANILCPGPDTTVTLHIKPAPHAYNAVDIVACDGQSVTTPKYATHTPGFALFTWSNDNTSIGLNGGALNGNSKTFTAKNTADTPAIANITVTTTAGGCTGTDNYTITINPKEAPTVSISTNDLVVCTGGSSLITTKTTLGGTAPIFKWLVDGVEVSGSTSDSFILSNVQKKTTVQCIMTSNSPCASILHDTSEVIVIDTSNQLVPTLTISSAKDSLCEGENLVFNASLSGAGGLSTYQWNINNSPVSGATSDVFITNSLTNGQVVNCVVNPHSACISGNLLSNNIRVAVFPIIPTALDVFKSEDSICPGDTVRFYTSYSGEGKNAQFLWTLNGEEKGTNPKEVYLPINSILDQVTFKMTSGNYCATPKDTTVKVRVSKVKLGPVLLHEPATYKEFCEGDSVLLVTVGLTDYDKLWSNGDTTGIIISDHTETYYVTMSHPSLVCSRKFGPYTTYMNLKPSKPIVTVNGNYLISTIADNYQWQFLGLDIQGATEKVFKYKAKGNYRVKVVNSFGCKTFSDKINPHEVLDSQTHSGILTLSEENLAIYPNPASNEIHILTESVSDKEITLFNLLGQVVYTNKEKAKESVINVEQLAKGTYILLVTDEKNIWKEKVEVE